MQAVITKLGRGGRLVIPAQFRKALGLQVGDGVMLRLEKDELRLLSMGVAIRNAQQLVRRYVPTGRSLVEELIHERHAEEANEQLGS